MTSTRRPLAVAASVVAVLALLLLALAIWLAVVVWWDQRTDPNASSYGVLGYAGAFVLAVLAGTSLSTARASRAAEGARAGTLLVLAVLPLLLVVAFAVAGAT